jgi:1,4-alpha-glucan branching enzyme
VFLDKRVAHFRQLAGVADVAPIIVAPFDAELFGHWWFEGPQWLELFIRKAAFDQTEFELVTLGDYLDRHPVHQTGQPGTSTWGHAGYFDTWLSGKTDWIYDHLVDAAARLERVAVRIASDLNETRPRGRGAPIIDRALDQAVRELLLAQSSDWPFIISSGTSAQYAERRVRDHVARLHWLLDAVETGRIDEEKLAAVELVDNPFPGVDWRVFSEEVAARPCDYSLA